MYPAPALVLVGPVPAKVIRVVEREGGRFGRSSPSLIREILLPERQLRWRRGRGFARGLSLGRGGGKRGAAAGAADLPAEQRIRDTQHPRTRGTVNGFRHDSPWVSEENRIAWRQRPRCCCKEPPPVHYRC